MLSSLQFPKLKSLFRHDGSQTMSAFNPQPVINALLDKHLGTAFAEFGVAIVKQLADQHGFDAQAAVCELGLDTISIARSTAADAKPASTRRIVPAFPLPYCGQSNPDWCRALKANHGLYTQCTMPPGPGSDLCKTCAKACEANGGACVYGRIEDRGQDGWQAPSGATPTHYSKVMKKLKIDAALVAPEAAKFGWELPAGCTEPVPPATKAKAKKTEPVSPIVGSEEDTPPAPPKKGGRPARVQKPVTATGAGDDLIAQLIAEAREERPTGSPVSDAVAAEQALKAEEREQAEIERTAALVRQDAQKANDKRSKQEEKEAKARAKQEEKEAKARAKQEEKEAKARAKQEEKEAKARAKQEEKEAKARAKREEKEAKAKAKQDEKEAKTKTEDPQPSPSLETELFGEPVTDDEEAGSESAVEVTPFGWEGVEYLRDDENRLYDPVSQDQVGTWDEETGTVVPFRE